MAYRDYVVYPGGHGFSSLKEANAKAKRVSQDEGYAYVQDKYTLRYASEWHDGKRESLTRRNPAVRLPSKFTPAEVRVNEQGKVQIRINPAKLGSGGRFAKCVESVTAKGGALDPRAVCAAAGRKKYGAKKFAAMARTGRKRASKRRK